MGISQSIFLSFNILLSMLLIYLKGLFSNQVYTNLVFTKHIF
jgi:hypothetical protein